MAEELSAPSIEDLEREADAEAATAARAESFFAREVPARRGRIATRSSSTNPEAGEVLVKLCSAATQKRYHTLLHFERGFPEGDDYGMLIGPACQLFEAELNRLVTSPALQQVWQDLLGALQIRKEDQRQLEALTRWREKHLPTTLGTQCLVLQALRRGCEHGISAIHSFLAASFKHSYVEFLQIRQPDRRLNYLRDHYRNPACHGDEGRFFDGEHYRHFVQLLVAHDRFDDWDRGGPIYATSDPRGDVRLFHHHLCSVKPG